MIEDNDMSLREDELASDEELAKQLFRIFKQENEAQRFKVVNMLEVFTALILLTDFSVQQDVRQATPLTAAERLQSKADMLEHKVNLLILLFSFRETQTLNISEIIILAKTCFLSLKKVFPGTRLFKNKDIQSEIKTLMMALFQRRIEDSLKEEKLKQQLVIQKQLEKQQSSKSKIMGEAVMGVAKKKSSTVVMNEGMISAVSGTGAFGGGLGYQQASTKKGELDESIEDKKERLFKWNAY